MDHRRKSGKRTLPLSGEGEKLQPITEPGSGSVQERQKALLAEIIAKVNDLFHGDVTEGDRLIYVNNVINGNLLESETLAEQAANNTKEQFSNSPDLTQTIIDAFDAHTAMSQQALDSAKVRDGLREVLLGPGELYEGLRERAGREAARA